MSRDKQIEEMAKEICSEYDCVIPCQSCGYYGYANCSDVKSAEKLYIAGYRKASDVAREISQDIIEPLWNAYKNSTCQETVLLVALICETINNQLKKKYESEGEG